MSRAAILEHVKRITKMTVQTGPFAGLRLHDVQTWGNGEDIGPQLLGVYEQELHGALEGFLTKNPSTIINVGCAEGYYAIGLGLRLPHARIWAFDVDPRAQEACRANAVLNGINNRIEVAGACSPTELGRIATIDSNILAVLDCEGAELALVTASTSVAALQHADMLVEIHDFLDNTILPSMMTSLASTHRLSLVFSGARNPHAFPFLDKCADIDKWLLVCENRPEIQKWVIAESRAH
jgi:Ribosomal protein L11 methyltransferase (PrmA)